MWLLKMAAEGGGGHKHNSLPSNLTPDQNSMYGRGWLSPPYALRQGTHRQMDPSEISQTDKPNGIMVLVVKMLSA